jgi:putative ABC transport system ATP-binding protein
MLFDLDRVSLTIDGHRVLDKVSTSIPAKGITVVSGPSGAGKSTLLRLLNRLDVPTEGVIRFRGRPLAAIEPLALRRRVGMVFQRPTPFPGTVRDNLLVADPAATDGAQSEMLRQVGLDPDLLDREADKLSGGESQRMCLARTLLTNPEVLLMDEPTSALDEEATLYLEQTARRLADGGMPMVWVTHNPAQVTRLADSRLAMAHGRIVG